MDMLFVRGDGVILVRLYQVYSLHHHNPLYTIGLAAVTNMKLHAVGHFPLTLSLSIIYPWSLLCKFTSRQQSRLWLLRCRTACCCVARVSWNVFGVYPQLQQATHEASFTPRPVSLLYNQM